MQTDPTPPKVSARPPPEWLLSLLADLVLFGIVLWRWIEQADVAEPIGYLANIEDRWLVPWIIGWASHILPLDPGSIWDVPINYPATAQLTAIEHFLSTAIVVSPVYWLTGNAVLAANVAAIASYPLAAFVMSRLLVALGVNGLVAWMGGIVFALGPERVPGNLIVLKYLNLYLPLVALCLTKLRERPTPWRSAALALALAAALFSSYYAAVLVLFAGGIWGVAELMRPGPGRGRYFVWAIVGSGVAMGALILFSVPYFGRPEAAAEASLDTGIAYEFLRGLLAGVRTYSPGRSQIALGLVALVLIWRSGAVGILARRGWVITLLAAAFMQGSSQVIFGQRVYLPFALLAFTPASFFRYPFRFSILYGFGVTLLVASTTQAVRERLGNRIGTVAVAVLALLTLSPHLPYVGGWGMHRYETVRYPIYDAVKQVAAEQGAGPLLELPHDRTGSALEKFGMPRVEVQSMVAWTRHSQPLIVGYVDFPPPHRKWLDGALRGLPSSKALQDVIDMTHLRWILLQPEERWDSPRERARILRQPGLTKVLSQDGWDLLRVDRPVLHPTWFEAIKAGVRPGYSVLGTPLVKLRAREGRGIVLGNPPRQARADSAFPMKMTVTNLGTTTWPVAADKENRVVQVLTRWWPSGAPHRPGTALDPRLIPLSHDLAPGETDSRIVYVTTPPEPGTYDVELRLAQGIGGTFDGPGSLPFKARIRLMRRPETKHDEGEPPSS